MIKHIIFDLDDTLCDYQKATQNAKSPINEVLDVHGIDIHAFWERFNRVKRPLFRQFADKAITRDEYRIRRCLERLPRKISRTILRIKSYLHAGN